MAEYRSPQNEPGNESRLLILFALTFVFVLGSQFFIKKFFPTPTPPAQTQTQSPAATSSPQPTKPTATDSAGTSAKRTAVAAEAKQAAAETETVIENDLYRITFTNRGAQVKSWILKKFDNDTQTGKLDLVNDAASQKFGYPLSLWTYDEALRNRLSSALYVSSQQGVQTAPATIAFEYSDAELTVHKTFSFDHSYVVHTETSVLYKGSPVPALPAWPSGFGDQTTPAFYASALIDYQYNKNVERLALKKISGGATIPGPFHWAGPNDQYFAAIFIPDDPANVSLVTLRNLLDNPADAKHPFDLLGAAAGNLHGPTVGRWYVGPKELAVLEKVLIPNIADSDKDLSNLVDFGFWGLIAKPLFLWLKWTYSHIVPNWGWAIIIQTLIISLALLPLRISQMKSMLRMQRISPQIKAIQEKYKKYKLNDPRKAPMNEEISALYKKEGVNPIGGCLPMIIQLPFLYAYYRMLAIALDLRHAHWLWIHDLSAPETLVVRILPLAMVVSMLISQKMTPQVGMDPAQQRMMTTTMPLVMGFIFWNLAAGLNLYYTTSNLISIIQQSVMNRSQLGREMREILEKRARKKDK